MKTSYIIIAKPQDWETLQYSPMPPEYPLQNLGPIVGNKKHSSLIGAIKYAIKNASSMSTNGIERPWHLDHCILRSTGTNSWTFLKTKDFDIVCDIIRYPEQMETILNEAKKGQGEEEVDSRSLSQPDSTKNVKS